MKRVFDVDKMPNRADKIEMYRYFYKRRTTESEWMSAWSKLKRKGGNSNTRCKSAGKHQYRKLLTRYFFFD